METNKKQAVSGFKIVNFQIKKSKDTEKLKLSLEADIDDIGAGTFDMGEVMKAFLHHQTGDVEIALSVFMSEKATDLTDDDEES